MFYFSKKVRLFSQNDVLFLFYFLINPAGTTVFSVSQGMLDSKVSIPGTVPLINGYAHGYARTACLILSGYHLSTRHYRVYSDVYLCH